MDYKIPNDLKYTKTHEWVKIDDDFAVSGITDYAQDQLGDIVYIEFSEIHQSYKKGDEIAEIESVKAIGEMYAPVSGELAEVNESINDTPELVNESPYEKAWLLKIKISDSNELEDLLSADEYIEILNEESS